MSDELLYKEFEQYRSLLKSRLSEYRFHHSICVAKKCVELCEKYGGNKKQMYLAGLLHDITKESSVEESEEIFKNAGYELTRLERENKKVWHQISGSFYVKNTLQIHDEQIISSIRFHTTLHNNPIHEEKILFIADFTSDDRDFDDVDVVREKADKSLDEAIIYALEYTIRDLVEGEKCIHPDTIDAYNYELLNAER